MKVYYLFVFCILGLVYCQISNDLDTDLKNTFQESGVPVSDLEKQLREHGFENFNDTKPVIDKYEKVLKEKCEKNGAPEAVELLKGQNDVIKDCITQYVDFSEVKEELDKAQNTGSMDEVFAKYCNRWPDMYRCLDNFTMTARKCMDDKEQIAFNKSLDILGELQGFVCFKDGDRLAMFVAEGGIECMQNRTQGIQDCINSTIGDRLPTAEPSITNLPTMLFTEGDCEDFVKIQTCIVEDLEKCMDSTPANIVDALFKFLKKHMPCDDNQLTSRNATLGSSTNTSSTFVISYLLYNLLICFYVYRYLYLVS